MDINQSIRQRNASNQCPYYIYTIYKDVKRNQDNKSRTAARLQRNVLLHIQSSFESTHKQGGNMSGTLEKLNYSNSGKVYKDFIKGDKKTIIGENSLCIYWRYTMDDDSGFIHMTITELFYDRHSLVVETMETITAS